MTIILYKTADERNRLVKSLNDGMELTGSLREECSILKPEFKISTPMLIADYNYCYIPDFTRYYFITGINIIRSALYSVSAEVDVLMTYADQIKNLDVIARRSTNLNNYLLQDNQQVTYNNMRIQTKEFSNGFDTPTFVLTTSGGGT